MQFVKFQMFLFELCFLTTQNHHPVILESDLQTDLVTLSKLYFQINSRKKLLHFLISGWGLNGFGRRHIITSIQKSPYNLWESILVPVFQVGLDISLPNTEKVRSPLSRCRARLCAFFQKQSCPAGIRNIYARVDGCDLGADCSRWRCRTCMGSKGIMGEGCLGCAPRCEAGSCDRSSHAVHLVVGTMVLNCKKRKWKMWNCSFTKKTLLILLMCLSLFNEILWIFIVKVQGADQLVKDIEAVESQANNCIKSLLRTFCLKLPVGSVCLCRFRGSTCVGVVQTHHLADHTDKSL